MIVLFFGPPGSGKGTQAARVAGVVRLPHVATGDMLRGEVERQSPLGREVQPIMQSGALVPDGLVVRVIEARLSEADARAGVLLDGFPRTVAQADALDAVLRRRGERVNTVLSLQVPDEELWQRVQRRAGLEGRADDTADAFQRRLGVYRSQTTPVLEHYRRGGAQIAEVDGVGRIEDVTERIRAAIEAPGTQARAS